MTTLLGDKLINVMLRAYPKIPSGDPPSVAAAINALADCLAGLVATERRRHGAACAKEVADAVHRRILRSADAVDAMLTEFEKEETKQ